ncbi:hypothetical protein Dimus_000561, partial [Dionaea muscipula]
LRHLGSTSLSSSSSILQHPLHLATQNPTDFIEYQKSKSMIKENSNMEISVEEKCTPELSENNEVTSEPADVNGEAADDNEEGTDPSVNQKG